jgi:hypothetical protein
MEAQEQPILVVEAVEVGIFLLVEMAVLVS